MTSGTAAAETLAAPDEAVFIDGEWVSPTDCERIAVINPTTEQPIGSILDSPANLGARALASARHALGDWRQRRPSERAAYLDALADAFERHRERLAVLASTEIGMPLRESRAVQVDLPVRVLRSTAEIARSYGWESRDASGSTIVRESVGVVLGITPWNFPVHQIIAKVAPALAAGCTFVLKPAELTPLNALFVAGLCDEIGLPPGVLNVVTGTGATTGEALLTSGEYDLVSFTGSLRVGRHVGTIAGEHIVPATLELGGKSPAVVAADADLDAAVRTTVKNCFTNAGQKCNAPTRLLVPEKTRPRAIEIAVDAARSYVLGDPLDDVTTMGPLASESQRTKVTRYLDEAVAGGAHIERGMSTAGFEHGFFTSPAIVTDVAPSAPVVQEEVFGPVLAVLGHEGDDHAVALANDTEYGLSAEVWSGDQSRAATLARQIYAGQVRVNGVRTPSLPVSPFGGFKRSGFGRELGPFALEEYLEIKAILGDPEWS